MPTLIDCYIVKELPLVFSYFAYSLRRKSFCLSAAEKRDYEAFTYIRQVFSSEYCALFVLFGIASKLTTSQRTQYTEEKSASLASAFSE